MPIFRSPVKPPLFTARQALAPSTVIAGFVAALAACGQAAPPAASNAADDITGQVCCVVSSSGASDLNSWDFALITWLVPHDALASEMAILAPTNAQDSTIKNLAAKIDATQRLRYQKMTALAADWAKPVPSTEASGDSHNHGVNGDYGAKSLIRLSGRTFDQKFLTFMIAHHRATLPIARATIDNGTNDDAKQFAEAVRDVTQDEIALMRQVLRGVAK